MRATRHVLLVLMLAGACAAQEPLIRENTAPIAEAVRASIDRGRISGAVVRVSVGGKPILFEAYGQAHEGREMRRDALFRIASMTKPITSVGIMVLVEEGQLGLDDPLDRFIPEFAGARVQDREKGNVPLKRAITLRDLLTHTSGIGYAVKPPEERKDAQIDFKLADGLNPEDPILEANIRAYARMPLLHQPGERWTYGMNTDILGRVIEVASGMPLDAFLEARIFRPLRMRDTAFRVTPEKAGRLAGFFTPGSDPDQRVKEVETETLESGGTTLWIRRVFGPVHYLSGGAGLVSTADDYGRFLQMMLDEGELDGVRLLKAETVREMTRNQIGSLSCGFPIHGDQFGLGFGITTLPGRASIGSYSWGGMYHTFFWVDPRVKLTAIVMTQLWPWGESTLWEDFQESVYAALGRLEAIETAGGKAGLEP